MLSALAARLDAIFHIPYLLATLGAGLADLGADLAQAAAKVRTAQHEISRGLADLSTIHHQPEMLGLDMFAP
jgi:hypothetical protein